MLRKTAHEFLVRALVYLYFSEPMPRGMGARAAARYVAASVIKATLMLAVLMTPLAMGRVADAFAPTQWRRWVSLLVAGAFTAPIYWYGSRLNLYVRRYRSGECIHCGYNLTGNVSGVCPECGAPAHTPPDPEPPTPPLPRSRSDRVVILGAVVIAAAALAGFTYTLYRWWNVA